MGAFAKKAMCSKIKIKGCSVFNKMVAYALSSLGTTQKRCCR